MAAAYALPAEPDQFGPLVGAELMWPLHCLSERSNLGSATDASVGEGRRSDAPRKE
jgi:hypothetical protein